MPLKRELFTNSLTACRSLQGCDNLQPSNNVWVLWNDSNILVIKITLYHCCTNNFIPCKMQSTTSCISKRNPTSSSSVRIIHTNGQAKTRSRSALSSLTSVAANLICKLSKIYHPQPLVYFKTKCRALVGARSFVAISRSSYYRLRWLQVLASKRAAIRTYKSSRSIHPRMHSRPQSDFLQFVWKVRNFSASALVCIKFCFIV